MAEFRLAWLVVLGLVFVPQTLSQNCESFTQPGLTTNMWPVTWVPGCTAELKFSVKISGAGDDGVARILLASDPWDTGDPPSYPHLQIDLGWKTGRTGGPGDGGTPGEVYSFLGLCTATDTDCDDTAATSIDNGDITDSYQTFVLTATSDSVSVAYDGQEPFLSLNNLGSTSLFDPQDIRYVGILSHDGATPGDESTDWTFCTDDFQSLASGATLTAGCSSCTNLNGAIDGGISPTLSDNQCFESTSDDPAYLKIDLGEEKHVVGVTIYNVDDGNSAADPGRLEHVAVFVGSCEGTTPSSPTLDEIQTNVMCSAAVSSDEAMNGEPPVYRACPTNTYGRYVFIADTEDAGATQIVLCEVIVHGKSIPDADKTQYQFSSATYSVMESPTSHADACESNDANEQVDVTVNRICKGQCTCGSVDIIDKNSGSANANDYDFTSPTTLTFNAGDTSEENTVMIKADCSYEGDETFSLELTNQGSQQVIGSISSAIVTIVDDDPRYTFSSRTASVREDVSSGKVTLTVERSGYTSSQTTVYVDTYDADNTGTCANTMIGGDYLVRSDHPVVFPEDSTSQTVDIYITNDDGTVDAENEAFCVTLDNNVERQGELTPWKTVVVTIENDDTIYKPCTTDSGFFTGVEDDGEILVQICREGKTDTAGCIDVFSEPLGGSDAATEGDDYDFPALSRTTIQFPALMEIMTISVPINNDLLVEGTEKFQLTLVLPDDPSTCGADISPVVSDSSAELQITDEDSTYAVTSISNSIPEDAGTVSISFQRSSSARSGTIKVKVSGGTDPDTNVGTTSATEGLDFTLNPTGVYDVQFEEGQTTALLTIPIVNDAYIELNEIFSVEIIEADSEINDGRKRVDVTILNDDAYFYIENIEKTVLESVGQFHVVVHRGPLEVNGVFIPPYLDDDVTIAVSSNSDEAISGATSGSDFDAVSKTLTFSGSTKDTVKTCAIKVIDDEVVEGQEEFFVTISNANVQIAPDGEQATITIEDDDGRITCSVDGETSITVNEDQDSITVTCTRDGIDNNDGDDQSLNRAASFVLTAVSESATQGQDFETYSKTLQFPPNVATITEEISLIIDDSAPESEETFRLVITGGDSEIDTSGNVITVTITDNDIERFEFEETEFTVGESCQQLQVTVVKSGGSGGEGTTLRISASDGPGSNGATYRDDYSPQEMTINILGNQQRQAVTFDISTDNVNEGAEIFTLTLSKVSGPGEVNPSAAVASITIQDNSVTYSVQDAAITRDESSGTQPVYFVRNGDFCDSEEIYVSTHDGTARAREDFISFSNRRVTFDRTSNTASVDLTILDDVNEEPTETFTVEIQSSNIQVGSGTTTVTIQDDDGRVYFEQSEYKVVEGRGTVTLTINRVGSTRNPSTVRVRTEHVSGQDIASPGSDYTAVSNQFIEFGVSESSKTFSVSILDDNDIENDETFIVTIVDTTDGVVSAPSEAVVIIEDDDERSGGLSTGAVIGIAAGVGGGVVVLMLVACLMAVMNSSQGGAAAAATSGVGRAPLPSVYRPPVNYPPGYGYGQGYGRAQGYYR